MSEKVAPIFQPNKDMMKSHLGLLFSGTSEQYKDGKIEISRLTYSEYFNLNEIEKAVETAVLWNEQGHNVYTTAAILVPDVVQKIAIRKELENKETLGRAKGEDFYAANAVWVDIDKDVDKERLKELYKNAQPNFYVLTSKVPHLRVHFWWQLDKTIGAERVKEFEALNKGIIAALGGDKGTYNCTRLMRLGGSVAWPKKDGRITESVEAKSTSWFPPHSFESLLSHYPVKNDSQSPSLRLSEPSLNLSSREKSEWSLEDIQRMLDFIPTDNDYLDWLKVGMALKDYGVPFEVWDRWSSKGGKYDSAVAQSKWRGFNGAGTTIGTIYYFAKNNGFQPKKAERILPPSPEQPKEEAYDPETGEILQKNKFFYVNAKDIKSNIDANDFVQGLLTEKTISVVYGESNCGKTFFMSDLAFHIVQGKEWNGKRVEKGNVLYLCLEGSRGLDNRIAAYKMEHGVDLDGFLKMPCPVNFMNGAKEDIPALVSLIEQANKEFNNDIKIVIIDTLARAISGGDENSGVDMGGLVDCADFIKHHTNAHICFIHHTGKDKARGARGHSSLRAAVDTEIEISRTEGADYSNVRVPKQRDLEKDDDFQFKLKSLTLGKNRHGEDVTSCVVEPYNIQEDMEERVHKKIKSGKTRTAFDALVECIDKKGVIKNNPDLPRVKVIMEDDFIEYLDKRGILSDNPKSAKIQYNRIRIDLIENDLLICRDDYMWARQ